MRRMLSAEVYRAEVGSATPSSMCSPPWLEIGDCDQANPCRVAQICSFFQETVLYFCQRSMNWQGFITENLFTRCSIPRKGARTWRFGAGEPFALLPDRSTDQTRELVS